MRGLVFVVFSVLMIVVLGACSAGAAPASSPTATEALPTATEPFVTAPAVTNVPTEPPPTEAAKGPPPTATQPEPEPTAETVLNEPTATPDLDEFFAFLDVGPDERVLGPDDARVTIVEYADYQCPACAAVAPWVKRLQQEYDDQVRLVFRHFPLTSIHDKALITAEAAEAAAAQGAFWEMHKRIFAGQQEWASVSPTETQEILVGYAQELDLDAQRFAQALEEGSFRDQVLDSYNKAVEAGLPGTPTFFFNRTYFQAPLSYYYLDAFVQLELLTSRQYDAPPDMVIDSTKSYQATIKTEKGDIVVQLEAEKAPQTVNNFVFLAREGWYDGVTFFRVLPDFMAQTGDPTNTGIGGPGYRFEDEFHPDLKHDQAGTLSMANSGVDTNGSQFFITLAPTPWLDAYDENGDLRDCDQQDVSCHAVFGHVVQGLEVLESLTLRNPAENPEAPAGDKIITIEIEESAG
jgi:cyclophilin family peptidyl-prolyl cis-trans isomerase/protein-disulfide isomerase